MTAAFQTVLRDTVACLLRLGYRGVPPIRATGEFQRLRRRYPDVEMDLVWEAERSGAVHYDVLLAGPDGGTLSVAFCPDRGVPWALRHAHHARESDVLRVNGRTLNTHTIMGYLDALWDDARLLTRLIDGCLMLDGIEAHAIAVSPVETKRAVAAFRRRHRLRTGEAWRRWLVRQGWTAADLEHELTRSLAAEKLRERLVGARVDAYFARHHRALDTAEIARLSVADVRTAARLCREIGRGVTGFFEALQRCVLTGHARPGSGAVEVVRRGQLPRRHATLIFGAAPDDVVGPLSDSTGHHVVRVFRVAGARLDGQTRELIKQRLLEQWLTARRREAAIEWFWGEADRVPLPPRRPDTRPRGVRGDGPNPRATGFAPVPTPRRAAPRGHIQVNGSPERRAPGPARRGTAR